MIKLLSATSFNAFIRDTFIDEAKKLGHEIDLINLHEEKLIKFYDGSAWNNVEATDTSSFATKGFSTAMSIAL